MRRKGFGLTLDAVISMMFILLIFLAMSAYRYTGGSETTTAAFINLHAVSEDVLDVMNKMGILDEVGREWTSGNESGATNLSTQYLDQLIPESMGYKILFDGDVVASNSRVSESDAIAKTSSVRLLAGYEKNRTTIGSVARGFLTGITQKSSAAYAYFGGFVGQGNITKYLHVPNRVTITGVSMEMDAGGQFNMYVNGQACNNPHSPAGGYLSADIQEDISGCAFNTGQNTIQIDFTSSDEQEWFIGGGFIKVAYNTSLLNESVDTGQDTFEFPGIEGLINYYSSFYVPGTLESMDIHLVFDNNYTTFLRIGDVLLYNSTGSEFTQTVDLDDTYLQGKLNYNALSENTVPIRLGTSNISEVIEAGNADVILITDTSGSMAWRIGYADSVNGVNRDCNDSELLDNDTSRISLARCLDKQFVDIILNNTGNRVGLVNFDSDANSYHSLSTDQASLESEIDGYSASGGTCVCCAINRAYNMLNSESSPEKEKFIIVMSDGVTGYCCGRTGWWWWAQCNDQGTSTNGRFSDCGGSSSDCTGGQCDGAIDNAIWSSQRAHEDIPATVHSVGFGPVANCYNGNYTMASIAEVGNGSYCSSTNATDLKNCYVLFAQNIVSGSIRSQIVNLSGAVTESVLDPSSYISYTYDPASPPLEYGEVSLSYDTDRFNDNTTCLGYVYIPSDVEAIGAKVTSYYSEHWTHYLHVSNSGGTRVAFRLSDYGTDYFVLGDPYIADAPASYINSGENNTVHLTTGDSATNETGCSLDNRAIITIKMGGSTPYGDVFPFSEGCNWDVEFDDGSTATLTIPEAYTGSGNCTYLPGNISYSTNDAIADTTYRLFSMLDLDGDGRLDIKFDANQIGLDTGSIGGVRSLWGPAQLKLVLWI